MRSACPLALGLLACRNAPAGPRTIAYAGARATLLAAFDGRVYWRDGSALEWTDGGRDAPGRAAFPGADWASRDNILVDATGAYVPHHDLLTAVQNGTTTFRAAGEHPAGVARQGDCIYVLDLDVECRGHSTLIGWPVVAGATCPQLAAPANGLQPRPFAADARRFYWANESCPARPSDPKSGIESLDRDTGAVTLLVPGELGVADLQVGSHGVYWRTAAGIRRASGDGQPGATTVVNGTVHSLAVVGGNIYYADDGGLRWIPEAGGTVHRVSAVPGVTQLVADARYLYWVTPAGDVVRAARPN